ncbi:MAG: hypothetical protein DBY17_07020 [Oscillospiraceae bacterium]|jgi:hypothetical protein|nr:MAG: hypothetical protein DBY17_07020 [Oscillospiraceae bacterium]
MLISASRRTDIPACFSHWFFRRMEEGYVLVRNPMNPHQVSRVSLSPQDVDGIMFWTKNPLPMLAAGPGALKGYMYCFQFTLNAYGEDVEPNIPGKWTAMVPAFRRLSEQIGPQRVLWRYDPIFLSSAYTPEWHLKNFAALAKVLSPYTCQCTISFLDYYRNTARNMAPLGLQKTSQEEKARLASGLAAIARQEGLDICACAEENLPETCGVGPASCIDSERFARLLGCALPVPKDKTQRPGCGCAQSVDIGAYHTCPNGCLYCYANANTAAAVRNAGRHDFASPLLLGELGPGDVVTERKMTVYRQTQMCFE